MVYKRNQSPSLQVLTSSSLWLNMAAFLGPFAIYLLSLNPSLFRNDTPEVVVGCNSLGVIHAPGYPLFMLAGRLFSFLRIGNPAMTLNLFAAFLGALAVLLFYLNTRVFLERYREKFPQALMRLLCLAAAWNFGLSHTFWGNALAAKGGIYVLQIALELSVVLAAQALLNKDNKPKTSYIFLFIYLFAMGFCNHWPTQTLFAVLIVLIGLWMFAQKSISFLPSQLRGKDLIFSLSLVLCAWSLYLYLPIRACAKPAMDFGAPTNFPRFLETVTRMTYLKVETLATASASYLASLFNKMEYISDHSLHEYCPYFALLALGGIFYLYKRNKVLCLAALGLWALVLFTNIFYLQADPIEYWHIADHMLTNNCVIGFLSCVGLFWLVSNKSRIRMHLALLVIACMLPFAYLNAIKANDQTRQFLYVGYGLTTLKSLPRDAIYFSEEDYDYFSALYLMETLHLRPDIHLILTPFLDRPYQFENALSNIKPLFQEKNRVFGKKMVFQALMNPSFNHPIFCTFPNAGFSESYLGVHPRLRFEPCGLLTHVLGPRDKLVPKSDFFFLSAFYGHYLASENDHPNEVNGLLREICAHPLLNSARYEKMLGNRDHLDWYFNSALELITEREFLNEVMREYKKTRATK